MHVSLRQFDADWPFALRELANEMHPVDRDACFIWFQFFPLALHELLMATPDGKALEQFFQFRGIYALADVADTSHRFLYGHRYWPFVRDALAGVSPKRSLVETIRAVAADVKAPSELTLPISAIGLMTLRQAGPAFLGNPYTPPAETRSPEDVLRERATDAKSHWFSKRQPRIIINEKQADGWFPLIPGQHITTAAERDKRPHHEADSRCFAGNGAIPVHCRAGSCGTCWVGVVGGNDKLAPVDDFERKRMAHFGYWESPFHTPDDPRPLIRLACQSIARGSCSIIIPSWNGVWGAGRRAAFERRVPGTME
jgi:ferredoxin